MKIISVCPGSAMANCYLIVHGDQALVVDPCVTVSAIETAAREQGATLCGILLTHGHFDHVLSLDTLRDATRLPAYIHARDNELLADGQKNAFALFFGRDKAYRPAEQTVEDGDTIPLGDSVITVIHTPGHTAGSLCYLAGDALLTGDTLFADSYGRYDLYSGHGPTLRTSLSRLAAMDRALTIYPGHGESAMLGTACDTVGAMLDYL